MRNSHAYIVASMNSLFGGSPRRLAALRLDAAKLGSNPHRTWKTVRYSKLSERYPEACPGFNEGPRGARIPVLCAFNRAPLPVRNVKFCDDVLQSIRHTGWFADTHGTTVRGTVCAIPHNRYLAGYYASENGEHVLFVDELFVDAEDCARAADDRAERYAEDQREDSERYDRMQDAEYRVGFKTRELADIRALRRLHRRGTEDVAEAIEALRTVRAELDDATRAYELGA